MAKQITFDIRVIKLGAGFIATTTLGGINLRGNRAPLEIEAVRNLLGRLSQSDPNVGAGGVWVSGQPSGTPGSDEAPLALELALNGTTFQEASQAAAELEASNGEES